MDLTLYVLPASFSPPASLSLVPDLLFLSVSLSVRLCHRKEGCVSFLPFSASFYVPAVLVSRHS